MDQHTHGQTRGTLCGKGVTDTYAFYFARLQILAITETVHAEKNRGCTAMHLRYYLLYSATAMQIFCDRPRYCVQCPTCGTRSRKSVGVRTNVSIVVRKSSQSRPSSRNTLLDIRSVYNDFPTRLSEHGQF